jgi:hypothetical protein
MLTKEKTDIRGVVREYIRKKTGIIVADSTRLEKGPFLAELIAACEDQFGPTWSSDSLLENGQPTVTVREIIASYEFALLQAA